MDAAMTAVVITAIAIVLIERRSKRKPSRPPSLLMVTSLLTVISPLTVTSLLTANRQIDRCEVSDHE
jgi:uncharacterized membrane protein YozB (DUF420 family)